jgi:ankyrin repeat protein
LPYSDSTFFPSTLFGSGDKGADLTTGDYDHRTALRNRTCFCHLLSSDIRSADLAAAEGHLDVVQYLLGREEVDVNVVDRFGFTPLQDAEKGKFTTIIQALKARGADKTLAAKNVLSYRLMDACNQGDTEEVRRLVEEEHADVNTADYDGRVPLHVACSAGHEPVVRYLLSKGANTDGTNVDSLPPASL